MAGTVDALADWVAGVLAREATARLVGDGDGVRASPAGDGSAMWGRSGTMGSAWLLLMAA
jgi:hypothetical protein